MSKLPRLSIGLPVYNGEAYLAESIEALLGQSFGDYELIISDNASTDGTADICHRYGKQDSRIRYIRQRQNIGLAPNHNFVADQAQAEYFKWAAADDLYARDLLKCCVEALDAYPKFVLAHAWTAAVDGGGNVTQALEYPPISSDSPSAPERFRKYLFGSSGVFEIPTSNGHTLRRVDNDGILRACDEYGVVRMQVLRKVAPHGSYYGADKVIQAEILLHGPFHETPEWLYFRRDHDARVQKSPLRTRAATLDPRRASRLRNPTSRLFAEYAWGWVAAIRRAPLSPADRRQCYRHLAHWVVDRAAARVLPMHVEPRESELAAPVDRQPISIPDLVSGQAHASIGSSEI